MWTYDPGIATVGSEARLNGIGVGDTNVEGQYDTVDWYTDGMDCYRSYGSASDTAPVNVKPTISGPQTLWWFNGQSPTGYATQITLTTSCSGTSWQWTVNAGTSKVTLGTNGSCSITVTSAAASANQADVSISVTVSGLTSNPYSLTVRAPYDLQQSTVTHQSDATFVYVTNINYTIRDQFGTQLPSGVPINEQWTTGVVADYSGMDWRRGNATGFSPSIAYFADIIQGETPSHTPTPSAPSSPLGTTAVYHWGQDWYIGSTSPGSGRRVQSNTLQKYTDHAAHANIVSPNP